MDKKDKEMLKQIQIMISAADNKQSCVDTLSNNLNSWRPLLESCVDKLHSAVTALQQQTANLAGTGATSALPMGDPAATHHAEAHGPTATSLLGSRPSVGTDLGQGHGDLLFTRGAMSGTTFPAFAPVTGTINFQTPKHMRTVVSDGENSVNTMVAQLGQANPSLQFPVFDGDNPQMWQTLAEQYFDRFSIHESYWISMSILNFVGSPKIWLHSVHKKLANLDWESFCALLCTRFGRDRHQLLIRQFYTIRQHDTVAEYIERFETVMNYLIAYSNAIHPFLFSRFIERLKNEIRAVVMVQRPQDLDTACTLALLQEEVADSIKTSAHHYSDFAGKGRPMPLPPPPIHNTHNAQAFVVVDRRGQEAARNNFLAEQQVICTEGLQKS